MTNHLWLFKQEVYNITKCLIQFKYCYCQLLALYEYYNTMSDKGTVVCLVYGARLCYLYNFRYWYAVKYKLHELQLVTT